jgi:hypothetical protein
MTTQELTATVRKKVEELFSEIEFIDQLKIKEKFQGEDGPDLIVEFSGKIGIHVLLVEIRTDGEPRQAREAISFLLEKKNLWPRAYPVFVAPYIPAESAKICRESKVGYMDMAGACRISFASVYIRSESKSNRFKSQKTDTTLSRPESGRIFRVLLSHPHREWSDPELAREANAPIELVSDVTKSLNDKGWADGKKAKLALTRPWDLLEKWITEAADFPVQSVKYYHIPMDFVRIENAIVEHCRRKDLRFAFTGLSGAVHLAPGVNYRQVQAYVSGDLGSFMEESSLKNYSSEANLAVIRTGDRGVFYKTRLALPASRMQYYRPSEKMVKVIEAEIGVRILIASPVQIYFDLKSVFRGCGKEAEKVFQHVLQPSW